MLYNEAALIHLYRIVQEAITNAARHAKPEKIEILLSKKDREITITIKDDGRGFIMENRTGGMGLDIMKYRAGIIDASINIRPGISKGTVIKCIFYDAKESEINITGKVEV
jgi:signal transduction histidine kinase